VAGVPGPLVIVAVAVPAEMVLPAGCDVIEIVNVWGVPTGLVSVAGVIEIAAFTQFFVAGPLLLPVASVVLVKLPPPFSGMLEVAETVTAPVVVDVITTLQLAVAAPPV
jgi:hypothetical protein